MFTNISDLKHGPAIVEFFNMLAPDWMNQQDKTELVTKILEATRLTLKELDDALEEGVQNGHSIEHQLALIKKIVELRGFK